MFWTLVFYELTIMIELSDERLVNVISQVKIVSHFHFKLHCVLVCVQYTNFCFGAFCHEKIIEDFILYFIFDFIWTCIKKPRGNNSFLLIKCFFINIMIDMYLPKWYFAVLIKHWNLLHLIRFWEGGLAFCDTWCIRDLCYVAEKINTLLDILLLMIPLLLYWFCLYQHHMVEKPSHFSNFPGNRHKVKSSK